MNANNKMNISMAIIIAGALISIGIIVSGAINSPDSGIKNINNEKEVADSGVRQPSSPEISNIKPVSSDDHILGDPNAPVVVVEFSDLECPFCKRFHSTMKKIIEEYDGRVAWVYRHFPLDSLHSKARKEAVASECAAEQGGNDAFWKYIDRIFEITPSNNGLDLSQLPEIANYLGLDKSRFNSCLNSGKYDQKIEQDVQDAVMSGGRGTPYSVVIVNGKPGFAIEGAQPYNFVKTMIENALSSVK